MRDKIILLAGFVIGIVYIVCYAIQDAYIREEIDGVENIDGITYLIKNTDIKYVMYKLSSTCISKIMKEKKFEVISENEGILTFGGINYSLNTRGGDGDIGAAYRIKCIQWDSDVIMKVSYEKRADLWWWPNAPQPGIVLNQAYHRFFKEVFDVQIIKQDKVDGERKAGCQDHG